MNIGIFSSNATLLPQLLPSAISLPHKRVSAGTARIPIVENNHPLTAPLPAAKTLSLPTLPSRPRPHAPRPASPYSKNKPSRPQMHTVKIHISHHKIFIPLTPSHA